MISEDSVYAFVILGCFLVIMFYVCLRIRSIELLNDYRETQTIEITVEHLPKYEEAPPGYTIVYVEPPVYD
jgi:hypothetical protein